MHLLSSLLRRSAMGPIALLLVLAVGVAAQAPTVRTMPGFPHAPNLSPLQKHPARPGTPFIAWGNADVAGGSAVGATYTFAFTHGPNLSVTDDGSLTGTVTDEDFIFEEVTFNLLGGSTREELVMTLTVDLGGGDVSSQMVEIQVTDVTDPLNATALDRLQYDVNISIQDGMRWLYLRQNASGYWQDYSSSTRVGETAFVLWAFQNQGHRPSNDPSTDIYANTVAAGLQWMLEQAVAYDQNHASYSAPRATVAGGATSAGVSDLNGNMQQILLCNVNPRMYQHGAAAAALVASGTPAAVVTTGPLSGMTYREVVEDAVDYMGGVQNATNGRGGWTYNSSSSNGSRSDMSINSWMFVAMEGAEEVFSIGVPDWIKEEVEHNVLFHQNNSDGASGTPFGYTNANPLRGFVHGQATTGGGLSGLVLAETGGNAGAIISAAGGALPSIAARRAEALQWVGEHWDVDSNRNLGYGNRDNFYGMWTLARALRLTAEATLPPGDKIVLQNAGVNFDWETGEENNSGSLAPSGSPREGYFPWLVRNQTSGGTVTSRGGWDTNNYVDPVLETAYAVLILTPEVFQAANRPPSVLVRLPNQQPQACPVTIPASEGVSIDFDLLVTDPDIQDMVTVTATGVPTGAVHNPSLPAVGTGGAFTISFTWSPTPAQVGVHTIQYTLDDGEGNQVTCSVRIEVGTCQLLLGAENVSIPLGGGAICGASPDIMYPVTMEEVPHIWVPTNPSLVGQDFYVQVVMNNPFMFPNRPIQVSPTLRVIVGQTGSSQIGSGSIPIWMIGDAMPDQTVTFGFDVWANN